MATVAENSDTLDEDLNVPVSQNLDIPIEAFFQQLEQKPIIKTQKVLLTFPLQPQFVRNTIDVGLGNLYVALRQDGYDVTLNLEAWEKKDFQRFFTENDVAVMGIKCYGSATPQIIKTVHFIRSLSPHTTIILGGPMCYADPKNVLNIVPADFAFHGECEEVLPEFLNLFLKGNERYKQTSGLIYRENDQIIVNSIAIFKDLQKIPYTALHKMRPTPRSVNYYYRNYPNAVVLKSRGCPAKCRFCANPFLYRERNIEHVLEEIKYLKRHFQIRELVFFDNNFNANKQHTRLLCRRLMEEKINLSFNVVHGMRIASIDEETIQLMAQAGCYKVSVGVESGDQEMLDYINKGYRVKDLPQRIGILKKHKIEVQAFVMIGLPYETDEQRRKTFRVTVDVPFDHVTYNIYTPYPGTELYEELVRDGTLKELSYNLSSYSRTQTDNRLTKHSPAFMRFCAIYYFLRFYIRPHQMLRTLREFIQHPSALYSLLFAFYKTYINAN